MYIEPSHQTYTAYLLGEPSLSAGPAPNAVASPDQGAQPGGSTSADTGDTSPAGSPAGSPPTSGPIFDTSQGSLLGGFRAPFERRLAGAQQELGQLQSEFQSAAGPSRTYESAGVEEALGRAVDPGTAEADRAGAKEAATGFLGANYSGPTGLDPTRAAALKNQFSEMENLARSLGTGAGFQSALRMASPSLTSGEARWEAGKQFATPAWRSEWRPSVTKLAQEAARGASADEEARAFAAQRKGEEEAIARRSREYLSGRQGTIADELRAKQTEAEAQNAATRRQLEDMRAGGEMDWNAVQGEENNPLAQRAAEARAKYDEIMGRYGDIADVPLLDRRYSPGRDFYLNPDWPSNALGIPAAGGYSGTIGGHGSPPLSPQVQRQLERQRELEALFQPFQDVMGSSTAPRPGSTATRSTPTGTDLGEYADVMPLYFGTPYEPGDLRPYLREDLGTDTARDRFASEDQRYTYNTISELLGSNDQLQQMDPFEAAGIVADMDGFLIAENNRIQSDAQMTDAKREEAMQQNAVFASELQRWLQDHPDVRAVLDVTRT